MADIRCLPDQRAPAFPDEPYSAYCRLCWANVYCLYIDRENHHGSKCIDGHTDPSQCREARAHNVNREAFYRARHGLPPRPLPAQD